jgi:hypothetical protein
MEKLAFVWKFGTENRLPSDCGVVVGKKASRISMPTPLLVLSNACSGQGAFVWSVSSDYPPVGSLIDLLEKGQSGKNKRKCMGRLGGVISSSYSAHTLITIFVQEKCLACSRPQRIPKHKRFP